MMKTVCRARWFAVLGCTFLSGLLEPSPLPAADAPPSARVYDAEVQLLGAVRHPGWYPISAQSTLAELIRRAGGLTRDAAPAMSVVRKGQKTGFIVSLDDPAFRLQPDDELRVLWTKLK
jgi:hypothetical protein